MDTLTLPAQPRETGTKAAKATRRAGLVPAVLYGHSTEPVHFAVEALALRPLIHTTETYRVALALDGATHDCIVKQVDYHPVTDKPIHVDFIALVKGEKMTINVPIVLEGTAPGVRDGGELVQPLHELEVRCLPKDMPGHIGVDVSGLHIGETLHVSDLTVDGAVEVLTPPERTLVTIHGPRVAEEDETAAAELAEGDEAAEGDADADEAEGADEA